MVSLCHITKTFMKKFDKNCVLKTSFQPFCVCEELSPISFVKRNLWNNLCIQICIAKTIKICPIQYTDLLRFLFTEYSLEAKKGLGLVSRPHFSWNFSIKDFLLQCYINWPYFMTRLCLLPKLFHEMSSGFHA